MKIKQSLILISIVLISLLAISAVSAEDSGSNVAAISDADDSASDAVAISDDDDSADALAVDESDEQVSVENADDLSAAAQDSAVDSESLGVANDVQVLSAGSGGGGKFNFSNMTINLNGTTFNIGDLTNGTFSLGNGTSFNISSLLNGTFSMGNGTSFNISSILNRTGNGTTTFDISSFMNIFGGSKLTANTTDITQVYSGNTIFKATILDSNKTVDSGKTVIFTINNQELNARTDANGMAMVSLNLKAGTYYIYTEYNNEILAKNQIVIKKAASKLTAVAKKFKAKTKVKRYYIVLKNNKGKAIKNAKVTLKIKGKTYTAKTNAYGKAVFKITKFTKKGKYTAIVSFAGNGYYKACKVSKKITIK